MSVMATREGAVLASLPKEQESRAHAEWPYNVGLVYLKDLIVDDEYQRPRHHKFISEIASRFDETLVGCIDINQRRQDRFAILDGQQRFWAMQQVGKTTCWAAVYEGLSLADEAGFFYRKNKDRKSMNVFYAFRARTIAGDPEALEIRAAVENQGFALAPASNDREAIGAVRAIETVWGYPSEHREEALTPTLVTIRNSVFGRKDSLSSWLIMGIGRFWQCYADDEVDMDALSAILLTTGPGAAVAMARERQLVKSTFAGPMSSLPWTIARMLADEYNRKMRGSSRATDFPGRLDTKRVGL